MRPRCCQVLQLETFAARGGFLLDLEGLGTARGIFDFLLVEPFMVTSEKVVQLSRHR